MASSSGVSRLKGTLEEVVRAGVGNNGGLVEGVGNSGCRELEEAPVTGEGRNVLRASFCFSSCNLAYATAWLNETGCSTWTSRRIAGFSLEMKQLKTIEEGNPIIRLAKASNSER